MPNCFALSANRYVFLSKAFSTSSNVRPVVSTNDMVKAFLVSSAFVALINMSLVIPLIE